MTASGPNPFVENSPNPRLRKLIARPASIVALLFVVHCVGLVLLFDPIGGAVNSRPLIEQDYGLHFHHLTSMEGFWKEGRRLWGYNPYFMAGYPSNTIQDASIKLFELLALATPFFSPLHAMKLIGLLAAASVPWLMFFAAWNFFGAGRVAVAAAALGVAYWWNSLPREMFFYGMVSFPVAVCLSLLAVSLLYRLLTLEGQGETQSRPARIGVAWIVCAALVLPLHPQSVVVAAPGAAVLLIAQARRAHRKSLAWIGAGIALGLVLNSFWLIPFFTHRGDDVSREMVRALPLFTSTDRLMFIKDYLTSAGYWTFRDSVWEKGLRLFFLCFGALGLARLFRERRAALGAALSATVLVLFYLAYFGSLSPLFAGWQPVRFKVALDLALALSASFFLFDPARDDSRRTIRIVCAAAGALTVVAFAINIIQTESKGGLRLRTGVPPEMQAVIDWVRDETPADGRVLFEESGDESGFAYDGMYLTSFAAHLADRALIGGPLNLYNDRHHFAEFHSGRLFKRDIMELSDEELRTYLMTYNIGAIVAFHPRSLNRLQAASDLIEFDRRIGQVALMKVRQPLNWFLKGEGSVRADFNSIRCTEVSGPEVILKFHWVQGLRCDPPARIELHTVLDDPIPFIRIVDPPSEFTLRIGG